MNAKRIALIVLAVALISSIPAVTVYYTAIKAISSQKDVVLVSKADHSNMADALRINAYYYRFDVATNVSVVKETLDAIDKFLPKYFPEGPYTRKDFIAIAMVESNFNQYLTGKAGEFGVFQLMPESMKYIGVKRNQFDLDVNTEAAMMILRDKHTKHKDYKMGIIAYNGVVKLGKGKVSETYWNKFIRYRKALDDILVESSTHNY
jgi:soluble lytic murein transglycosylase-like protein